MSKLDIGSIVTVVGGRTLPHGTTGTVSWIGRDTFRKHSNRTVDTTILPMSDLIELGYYRIGLKIEGRTGLAFLNAKHVAVSASVI